MDLHVTVRVEDLQTVVNDCFWFRDTKTFEEVEEAVKRLEAAIDNLRDDNGVLPGEA